MTIATPGSAFAEAASGARPPADEVRAIVACSGSSFTSGMRILPRPRREAIYGVYAFCRVVDDIADGEAPAEVKRARLADWEEEVARIYAGEPASAVGRALLDGVARYELPAAEFVRIIEGMRIDVAEPVRMPDAAALEHYMRCVAGAVGQLSMRIFGAWVGAPSARFATELAAGLQLVNILRDVDEDARRGRLYLPSDLLARCGVPADPVRAAAHPRLPQVRAALGAEAERRFAAARSEIPAHRRLRLVPALLMLGPYERLLAEMRARNWTPPPPMSSRRKAWLGLACVLRTGFGR